MSSYVSVHQNYLRWLIKMEILRPLSQRLVPSTRALVHILRNIGADTCKFQAFARVLWEFLTLLCETDKEHLDKNIIEYYFFIIYSLIHLGQYEIFYISYQLYPPLQEKCQFKFVLLQNQKKHLCTGKCQNRNDWVISFLGYQTDRSWALEKALKGLTLGH